MLPMSSCWGAWQISWQCWDGGADSREPWLAQGDEELPHRAVPGWQGLHPEWECRCPSPESPSCTFVPLPPARRSWKEVVASGIRQGINVGLGSVPPCG